MKSFACLLAVLLFALPGPVLSEESVFPAETNSEAAALSQIREIPKKARPTGSDLPDLLNLLKQKTRNIYFYQAPATNPVIAPFSFLAELDMYDLTASSSDGVRSVLPAFLFFLAAAKHLQPLPMPATRWISGIWITIWPK